MPEETTSPELQELTELLRRRGDRLPEQRKPNIVVCGQTGVGKTTTVNTLFGREVGAVGDYSRGSVTDELHEWEAHGQYIDIVDLPGLGTPPNATMPTARCTGAGSPRPTASSWSSPLPARSTPPRRAPSTCSSPAGWSRRRSSSPTTASGRSPRGPTGNGVPSRSTGSPVPSR